MTGLKIHLDGDGVWPDMRDQQDRMYRITEIARLRGGMTSGRSSVVVRIELGAGKVVIAETSLRNLVAAVRALQAREEVELGRELEWGQA